jgi:hypothetical protein
MIAAVAMDQPLIMEEPTVPQIVQSRLSRGVSFLCLSFVFLLIKREPFCSIELTPDFLDLSSSFLPYQGISLVYLGLRMTTAMS